MRVMVFVKATEDSEKGILPTPETAEMFEAMGRFNEELRNAGVLLAADGLKPSSQGKRIAFDGPGRTVIDGPFAETRELVAGFWLWEVKDMDEAVAWVKRCPNPMPGPSEIEIRPLYEMADLQEFLTPEARKSTIGRARSSAAPETSRPRPACLADGFRRQGGMTAGETHRAIEAIFRIERARLIAGLARVVRNVDLAEELAQDALVIALSEWPRTGVPANPGAWLMTAAKRRAIDAIRRDRMRERKHEEIARELDGAFDGAAEAIEAAMDDDLGDELWASSSQPATPYFRPTPAPRSRCVSSAV